MFGLWQTWPWKTSLRRRDWPHDSTWSWQSVVINSVFQIARFPNCKKETRSILTLVIMSMTTITSTIIWLDGCTRDTSEKYYISIMGCFSYNIWSWTSPGGMVAAAILHPIAPLQRLLHRAAQLQQLRLLLVVLFAQCLHLENKMLGDLTYINWEQNRGRALSMARVSIGGKTMKVWSIGTY